MGCKACKCCTSKNSNEDEMALIRPEMSKVGKVNSGIDGPETTNKGGNSD